MAVSLTGAITASVSLTYTQSNDLGQTIAELPPLPSLQLGSGTSENQGDLAYFARRTLSGTTPETLDLYGGLNDAFGSALNFAKIILLYVRAGADNAGNIVVGAGTNPWIGPFGAGTHTVKLDNGECFLATNVKGGWPVTNGTGDKLKIAHDASGASAYDIVIIGRTS